MDNKRVHFCEKKTIVASSDAALHRMKATKQRDTAPEMAIRRKLFALRLRYRVDYRPIQKIKRRADIVFCSLKLAIFIDGCFWHGCPIHGTKAKANANFWKTKIERNQKRDAETTEYLEKSGWQVIRIWEHENPEEASEKIYQLVMKRKIALKQN